MYALKTLVFICSNKIRSKQMQPCVYKIHVKANATLQSNMHKFCTVLPLTCKQPIKIYKQSSDQTMSGNKKTRQA
jgi:hypothetical protein